MTQNTTLPVSLILPVYNAALWLPETLASVAALCPGPAETILVDDASTDDSVLVIEAFQAANPGLPLTLLRQPENLGQGDARQRALEAAVFPWVACLDADDTLTPDALAKLLAAADAAGPETVLVYPAYQPVDTASQPLGEPLRDRQRPQTDLEGDLLLRNFIPSPSGVLMRTEALRAVGGFGPEKTLCEDWLAFIHLARRGAFAYVDAPLVRLRRHPDNYTANPAFITNKEIQSLLSLPREALSKAIFRRQQPLWENRIDWAALLIRLEHWAPAQLHLERALTESPGHPRARFYQGVWALCHHDWSTAEAAFADALRADPQDVAARHNLGVLRCRETCGVSEGRGLILAAQHARPGYRDAALNLAQLDADGEIQPEQASWTLRPLRPQLLAYFSG